MQEHKDIYILSVFTCKYDSIYNIILAQVVLAM